MQRLATRSSSRSAKLLIAAAALGVFVGVGCDDPDSPENQIKAGLANASSSLAAEQYDDLRNDLTALTQTDADAASLANTFDMLGQVDLAAARSIRNDANVKLVAVEKRMQDLAGVSANLADVNRRIASLRAADPTPSVEAIEATVAGLTGTGGTEQFSLGGADVTTVSSLEQRISQLEGQIAEIEQNRGSIETERQAALREAGELFTQADQQSGEDGMSTFRDAVAKQSQAADFASEQGLLDVELTALRADLQIAQAHIESLRTGVQNINNLKDAANAKKAALEEQIAAQQDRAADKRASAESLINGADGMSLADALAEAQNQVSLAQAAFASAVQRFGEGAGQTAQAGPGSAAPSRAYFDLAAGSAEREQGQLHLSVATSAFLRETIARAAENAGVTLPDALSSSASADARATSTDEARTALTAAEQRFADSQGAFGDAAAYLTGFTRFSLSQLATLAGDESAADAALQQAVEAVRGIDNVDLMPLPAAMRDRLETTQPPAEGALADEPPAEVESMDETPADEPAEDDAEAEMPETPEAMTDDGEMEK
ncbi:MAG: hypothetical protein AAF656_10160 [Planctomycetota bacterium]